MFKPTSDFHQVSAMIQFSVHHQPHLPEFIYDSKNSFLCLEI
jgi:hypothetical protein